MNNRYIITSATLALLALYGCGDRSDSPEIEASDKARFTAVIAETRSRAYNDSWDAADEIGISGCNRVNVSYVTAGGDGEFEVKDYGDQIYYRDDNEAIFTAYYPWYNLEDGSDVINVNTKDQHSQKRFDFLWARGVGKKSAPLVTFNFSHVMTKVAITVRAGHSLTYANIKNAKFSLSGASHVGTFNTTNGTTTNNGEKMSWVISDYVHYNDIDNCLTFSLILFPQVFEQPIEFSAELDIPGDNTYSLSAAIDFTNANRQKGDANAGNEWKAGKQYDLRITINKTNISLEKCEIESWNNIKEEDITVD